MITVEAWTTIRYLYAQGLSIRAIAKQLDISRNTVREALRSEEPPSYSRPKHPNPKLEPFADQIKIMLLEKQFIGSRILCEVRKAGYKGGPTAFYAYLASIKQLRPSKKPTERFETPPGHQGQFDWSPYSVLLGNRLTKVIVFSLVLGFSRRKFYLASLDETQASVLEALERGLWHFGGSPKKLLVDNARAFVLDASPDNFHWNPRFLEFCGHYRIEPVACRPYRPQTKGKVERPFYYLEEHFIKGASFDDFDHFCRELARFQAEELDLLIHSTTQQSPLERFEEERFHLVPLPERTFVGTREEFRKVSWDCLVSFQGSRYSVPNLYAGKQVWVRSSQGARLEVYDQKGRLLAAHQLSAKKGLTVINKEHYEGLSKHTPMTKVVLADAFIARFPDQQRFLDGLLAQYKLSPANQLRAVLSLSEVYAPEAMKAAFAVALNYNTYSHQFLKGVLQAGQVKAEEPTRLKVVFASLPQVEVTRSLGVYQELLEAR